MNIPRFGVAYVFYVSLVSQANGHIYQSNPTLASGDVKVAKADGAPANITTLPVVDADFTKRVKVSLSATEMESDGNVTVIFSDQSGAEWDDLTIDIPVGPNIKYAADDSYEYNLTGADTVERHRSLLKAAGLTTKGVWVKGTPP